MAQEEDKSYYGYRPPAKAFNWFEASEKAVGGIEKVIKSRVDERAKNEEYLASVNQALQKVESGSNKNYQDVLTNGAFSSKQRVYDMSQLLYSNQINSLDFRKYTTNIQQSWNDMAEISKNFNADLAIYADREQAAGGPKGSGFEAFNAQKFAGNAQWNDAVMIWDKNGNGHLAQTDGSGNIIDGSAESLFSINNLGAQLHDRVDVAGRVNKNAKLIGDFQAKVSGTLTTAGLKAWQLQDDQGYKDYLANLQGTMLNDPYNASSVLTDNGKDSTAYFFYQEGQLDDPTFMAGKDGAVDPATNLPLYGIKVIKDNDGNDVPELTDAQRVAAEGVIETELNAQIGIKDTYKAPPASSTGRLSPGQRLNLNQQVTFYQEMEEISEGTRPVSDLVSDDILAARRNHKGEIILTLNDGQGRTKTEVIGVENQGQYLSNFVSSGDRGDYDKGKENYRGAAYSGEAGIGTMGHIDVYNQKTSKGSSYMAKTADVKVKSAGKTRTAYKWLGDTSTLDQEEAINNKVNKGLFGYKEFAPSYKETDVRNKTEKNYAAREAKMLILTAIRDEGKNKILKETDIKIEGYGNKAKATVKFKNHKGETITETVGLGEKNFLQKIEDAWESNQRPSFTEWQAANPTKDIDDFKKQYNLD